MDYRLIIFDTDSTLVTTKSGATFRKAADDWQWLPGRIEKLRELKAQGVRLAVATNQGGVAFGYLKQEDILQALMEMTEEGGIPYAGLYVCYNMPNAKLEQYRYEDDRRKPGPGMLLEAMQDFEATAEQTLMVGDRDEDRDAAQAAGCSFQWSHEFFGDGRRVNL